MLLEIILLVTEGPGSLFVAIGGVLIALFVFLYFVPIGLWFTAVVSDVKVSILQLVLMRIRKVPPSLIVNAQINAVKAGLDTELKAMEAH